MESRGVGLLATKYAMRSNTYHLAFLFTVDEVVVILHRDKLVPPMLIRDILQCLEFPRCHRAGANISHPTLLNDIVQSLHDFLSWRLSVQAMDLEDIDVRAQSLDALLYCIEDVLAAQTDLVHILAFVRVRSVDREPDVVFVDAKVALREDDDLAAGDIELLERLANNSLGLAVGVYVGLNFVP